MSFFSKNSIKALFKISAVASLLILCMPAYIAHAAPSDDFVITVKTDNAGTSGSTSFTIPTTGTGYNYDIDWNNDNVFDQIGATGSVTNNFGTAGTYTIRIRGTFPRIYFAGLGDRLKILSVDQWGTGSWTSMQSAFHGCSNLQILASDAPNLTSATNATSMFFNATSINQSINHWDVSTITNMEGMFRGATSFNQPLDNWNVSNVTTMESMFQSATAFNQPLNSWNTGAVTTMASMFQSAANFDANITSWNTANVTNMTSMFYGASKFNQSIGSWNTSSVTNMSNMFRDALIFNQPLNSWNTGAVTTMANMFANARVFNQNLNSWNTINVTDMSGLFQQASDFNGNITSWNTANVTTLANTFRLASTFNQDIGAWNTGNVTSLIQTFQSSPFNYSVNSWDVSKVTTMQGTFSSATAFNQPLNSWNTGAVTTMASMFQGATVFNQPINSWNTGNVTSMTSMFRLATQFNQNIGSWDIAKVTNMSLMFSTSALSTPNYDSILVGWSGQAVRSAVPFSADGDTKYCTAAAERAILTGAPNSWVITDGGMCTPVLVTSVTSSTGNGNYKAGDVISVQVVFDGTVTVSGTPQLTLETGATDAVVNYASGSGSNTLTFTYTVGAGQNTLDLDYASTTSLQLNGGTINSSTTGTAATLTLPAPAAAGSLGANKAIVIDTTAPSLTNITSSSADGTYGIGSTINITATFSEDIVAPSTMTVVLDTGATVTLSAVTGNTLTGTYTVLAGHNSGDLTVSSITTTSVVDGASNSFTSTTLPVNNIADLKAIVIDSVVPAAPGTPDMTSATDSGSSNTDNITNDTTPTFSISCESGNTVNLYIGPTIAATSTCSVLGTVDITIPSTSEGTYMIRSSQTDSAGNESALSSSLQITIDETAPSAITVLSISGDTTAPYITSDTSPALTIQTDIGDEVTILGFACTPTPAVGSSVVCTKDAPDYTIPTTETVTVSIIDRAGNGPFSDTVTFTVGLTPVISGAPDMTSATDSGSSNTDNITNDTTPDFTLACTSPNDVTLYIDGVARATGTCSGTSITLTPSTSVSAGTHSVTYTETNTIGESDPSPALSIEIDTTSPTASIPDLLTASDTGASTTDDATYDTTPTFSVVCTVGDIVRVYYATPETLLGTANCTSSPVSVASITIPLGTYSITSVITDLAGNVSATSSPLQVTIQETPVVSVAPTTTSGPTGVSVPNLTTSQIQKIFNNNSQSVSQSVNTTNTLFADGVTTPVNNTKTCSLYIVSSIKLGQKNDPAEVTKLQKFLNSYENAGLVVDGVYKTQDMKAVMNFQTKYAKHVLLPWGTNVPTGYVFQTTKAKINALACAATYGCPFFTEYHKVGNTSADINRVKSFLNLLNPNASLVLNSTYDAPMKAQVVDFQSRYKDTVLKPWNLKSATSYWYKTSRAAAHEIMGCPESITLN